MALVPESAASNDLSYGIVKEPGNETNSTALEEFSDKLSNASESVASAAPAFFFLPEESKQSKRAQGPAKEPVRLHKATLQDRLDEVLKMCSCGLLSEAFAELQALEASAASQKDEQMRGTIQTHETLCRLREAQHNQALIVNRILEPALKEEDWVVCSTEFPDLSQQREVWRCDIKLRFLKGTERESQGSSTQIALVFQMHNCPFSLAQVAGIFVETDIIPQGALGPDVKHVQSTRGGPENCWSSFLYSVVANKLLPIETEELGIRHVSVHTSGPKFLPHSRPGLMTVDCPVPPDMTHYLGFELPKPNKRTRMDKQMKFNYFTPSPNDPERCVDWMHAGILSVPVWQWLVRLEFLKTVAASAIRAQFTCLFEQTIQIWDELEYKDRAAKEPALYAKLADIVEQAKGQRRQ